MPDDTEYEDLPEEVEPGAEAGEPLEGEPGQEVAVEEKPMLLRLALYQSSWWAISVVFHGLIVMLLTLLTWVVKEPDLVDASTIVTTSLEKKSDPLDKFLDKDNAKFAGDRDAKATDPNSTTPCDIEVPPDILAKAELGDHFETINPDRPDTQSAFGNPDAHMFHSVHGSDDKAGGGGTGGLSLDEVIGVGGGGSPGSGGGWGGGKGTGIGNDSGSGHGSFGQRTGGGRKLMVMRHGGSSSTERGVTMALEWLAKHQEEDGHWDCQKYEGKGAHNVSMTGFAVLAFLGAGHTEKAGKYRDNVQRGVYWLTQAMKDNGRWNTNNYEQGIAAMAMAEAAGMGRIPSTVVAAQKCIDGVIAGQHDYAAWDYGPNPDTNGRNDSSVSGWNVMALKSAKIGGLKVDHKGFAGAIAWLDAGQDLEGAKDAATDYEGGKMAYAGTLKDPKKGQGGIAVTASAALQRMFMGWKKDDPAVLGPANLFRKQLPKWADGGGGVNLYYWYYATLVMFQQGGEHWKDWNQTMKPALIENQRKDGDERGSWDPVGGGGVPTGGRVMSTALACLCLEVYYRYLPMYR